MHGSSGIRLYFRALALALISASQAMAAPVAGAAIVDDVQTTRELNVCTPASRKPFAYVAQDGSVRGVDVEMMQMLAGALNARVKFLQTPLDDIPQRLRAGDCDIGAGGIDVRVDRQTQVSYSTAYMVNGITPVSACARSSRYQTIQDLNRPGVRIVVLGRSLPEVYARVLLSKAQLRSVDGSAAAQTALAKGATDVYLTDSVNAVTLQKEERGLCAINPDQPVIYGEMAYMLPRGDLLTKEFVDQWLHMTKASGAFQQTLERWVK